MNTIVILVDSLRRDFLGCYGNDWIQTPSFDEFAESATVFENAYCGSYPCMPARRELYTGRYEFPWRGWGPLEDDELALPRPLRERGTTCALITDHYHLWERGAGNYHFDFDAVEFIRGQELDPWVTDPNIKVHYPASREKLAAHIGPGVFERYYRNRAHFKLERDYFAPQVFQRACDWLESNRGHESFFLLIDCFDPHEPFDPPYPYCEMYNPGYEGERITWPTYGKCNLTPEELRDVRALYAGEITLVDRWLGWFLDHARRLGLMKDTMIVIMADHGFMFGEHGVIGKCRAGHNADSNLYQELAHVPLMIYHPDQKSGGRRISHLVQTVDIFPTILDAQDIPVPDEVHGKSLMGYITGEFDDPIRDYAIFGRYGEAINITDGRWTLFLWPPGELNEPLYWYSKRPPMYRGEKILEPLKDGRARAFVPRGPQYTALYDLATDPQQLHNLIAERTDQRERLVKALKRIWRQIGAPREQLVRVGIGDD